MTTVPKSFVYDRSKVDQQILDEYNINNLKSFSEVNALLDGESHFSEWSEENKKMVDDFHVELHDFHEYCCISEGHLIFGNERMRRLKLNNDEINFITELWETIFNLKWKLREKIEHPSVRKNFPSNG